MDYEQRLISIRNFLQKYHYLWEMEIIERYPEGIAPQIVSWASQLEALEQPSLIKLENSFELEEASGEFKDYLDGIRELIQFERPEFKLPKTKMKVKVNLKKHHELQCISEFLKDKEFNQVLDFAGGMGHSSEMLHDDHHCKCNCIDFDKVLLKNGRERTKNKNIQYTHQDLMQSIDLESDEQTLCLGLHSCGPLSNKVIEFYKNSSASNLLNFGCCYHKLNKEFNLSQISKQAPLKLTNHALTLATRSNAVIDDSDFQFRWSVKSYRYALHMLMVDKGLCDKLVTLGNAKPADYQKPFSIYAQDQLSKVEMTCDLGPQQLDEYFQEKLPEIRSYFYAGLIRTSLARLIEAYIVLDRAQHLVDNGLQVQVCEFFDKSLSPRNLGIFSSK